jgi:hypothetical protein
MNILIKAELLFHCILYFCKGFHLWDLPLYENEHRPLYYSSKYIRSLRLVIDNCISRFVEVMLPAYKTLLVIAEGKLILDNITILKVFTPFFPLCIFTELVFF